MKVLGTSLSGLVGAVFVASSALAADPIPPPALPPAPPATEPAPAFSWTGFYLGAHGGYSWGGVLAEVDILNVGGATGESIDGMIAYPIAGVFGGLNAGFNFQAGPVVLGLNGEISIANTSGGVSWPFYGDPTDSVRQFGALVWVGRGSCRLGLRPGPCLRPR